MQKSYGGYKKTRGTLKTFSCNQTPLRNCVPLLDQKLSSGNCRVNCQRINNGCIYIQIGCCEGFKSNVFPRFPWLVHFDKCLPTYADLSGTQDKISLKILAHCELCTYIHYIMLTFLLTRMCETTENGMCVTNYVAHRLTFHICVCKSKTVQLLEQKV